MADRSCIYVVPAAKVTVANKLLAAMFGDSVDAQNAVVGLSPTGTVPITYYGGQSGRNETVAAQLLALNDGVLPDGLDLTAYDITEQEALGNAPQCYVADATVDSEVHFEGIISGMGLKRFDPYA